MKREDAESIVRTLIVTLLPMIISTILTVGILESYKNDSSLTKQVMDGFYRPMREAQGKCAKLHSDLAQKYGARASLLQQVFIELGPLAKSELHHMTLEYNGLLERLLNSFTLASAEVPLLEQEFELCRNDLQRRYEELAIVTGTYSQFISIAKLRAAEVSDVYAAKSRAIQNVGLPEYQELWNFLREFTQTTFNPTEKKIQAYEKISQASKPVIRAYGLLEETEHRIRTVETKMFDDLQEIFSVELSDRFHRGVVARLFF